MTNAVLQVPGTVPRVGPYKNVEPTDDEYSRALIQLRGEGLTHWWDPGASFTGIDGSGRLFWLDRCNRAICRTSLTATENVNPVLANDINALPALRCVGTSELDMDEEQHFNAAAWSAFVVAVSSSNETNYIIGQSLNIGGAGDFGPVLALQGGGAGTPGSPRIDSSAGAIRLSAPNAIPANAPALIGYFYSAARGLTIRTNGVQRANVANAQNLTNTGFQFFNSRQLTTTQFRGSVAPAFVFNRDLTDPSNQVNAEVMADLETRVMSKYAL